MVQLTTLEPVDYLILGHISQDMTPSGPRLGGTAAYAALTARAMGLRVGLVTAWGGEISLEALDGITIVSIPASKSTTFENITTDSERIQYLHHVAPPLNFDLVPDVWRRTPIIHLGPVAGEVDPFLDSTLTPTLLGLTPQGWLREWDDKGLVSSGQWPESHQALEQAGAAVLSVEDVRNNEEQIDVMALSCRILVVTEGAAGARLYWNGDLRRFRAAQMPEVDATGAGDIFAAAFFVRLFTTRDPWEAARFATRLASLSVQRVGLEGVPTAEEVKSCLVEVLH